MAGPKIAESIERPYGLWVSSEELGDLRPMACPDEKLARKEGTFLARTLVTQVRSQWAMSDLVGRDTSVGGGIGGGRIDP